MSSSILHKSSGLKKEIICRNCSKLTKDGYCRKCKLFSFDTSIRGADDSQLLSEIDSKKMDRLSSGPWDPCFGPANGRDRDGIVPTTVTLLSGDRGCGKSTLCLHMCDAIAGLTKKEALYIVTEQSKEELRLYADRLHLKNRARIRIMPAAGKDLDQCVRDYKPGIFILDSISGYTENDIKADVLVAKFFKEVSKKVFSPTIIINHVTKEGEAAGSNDLQHEVDTVLQMVAWEKETEEQPDIRELMTTSKNRFGKAFVSVKFEMVEGGLRYVELGEDDEDSE